MVGEHMQVLRRTEEDIGGRTIGSRLVMAEMERLGEVGRSMEKRTEGDIGEDPTMLTRLGEMERGKKVEDRAEKDVEEVSEGQGISGEGNASV